MFGDVEFRSVVKAQKEEVRTSIKKKIDGSQVLDSFEQIKVDITKLSDMPPEEALFNELLILKTVAQVLLNLYHNSEYFKQCCLIKNIVTIIDNDHLKKYADILNTKSKPVIDDVVLAILQYLVTLNLLKNTKKNNLPANVILADETRDGTKKCMFCDTDNEWAAEFCTVCEGDLHIQGDMKHNNIDTKNNIEGLREKSDDIEVASDRRTIGYNQSSSHEDGSDTDYKGDNHHGETSYNKAVNMDGAHISEGVKLGAREMVAIGDLAPSSDITSSSSNTWACIHCTFCNASKNFKCEICHKKRYGSTIGGGDCEKIGAEGNKGSGDGSSWISGPRWVNERGEKISGKSVVKGFEGSGEIFHIKSDDKGIVGRNEIVDEICCDKILQSECDGVKDYVEPNHLLVKGNNNEAGNETFNNYKSLRVPIGDNGHRQNTIDSAHRSVAGDIATVSGRRQSKEAVMNKLSVGMGNKSVVSSSSSNDNEIIMNRDKITKNKYDILKDLNDNKVNEVKKAPKYTRKTSLGSWACPRCTCDNESMRNICLACGGDQEGRGGQMDYNNDGKGLSKEGQMNVLGKQVAVANKINPDYKQSSDRATRSGDGDNDASVRLKGGTIIEATHGSVKEVWPCTECTFNNESKYDKCQVCDVPRDAQRRPANCDNIKTKKLRGGETNEGATGGQSGVPSDKSLVCDPSIGDAALAEGIVVRGAHEGPLEDKWPCPGCTFNNKRNIKCCEVCFSMRPEETMDDPGDAGDPGEADDLLVVQSETWKCGGCKSDNLFDRYICGKCRKYAPFFHKWVCDRCSFFNDELSPQCGACEAKNPHMAKCSKCRCNDVNVTVARVCESCIAKVGASKSTQEWTSVKQKKCLTCNNEINVSDIMCNECTDQSYYCNNQWCGAINSNKSKYCKKCKLKKGVNITDYNLFDVHDGNKEAKRWQCTFCGEFDALGKGNKCSQCKNMRHSLGLKKCECNWVNKANENKCYKCFRLLKREK